MQPEVVEKVCSAVWKSLDVGGEVQGQATALNELVPSPVLE
jgi:hypothetical protein